MTKKIVFLDQIGRTILAELVDQTDSKLVTRNPAMINVNQLENGQLQVQIFPLFFAEFLSEKSRVSDTTWAFNKNAVTLSTDLEIEDRLSSQYDKVFESIATAAAQKNTPAGDAAPNDKIKLFDE